jgi:hypothetical protein
MTDWYVVRRNTQLAVGIGGLLFQLAYCIVTESYFTRYTLWNLLMTWVYVLVDVPESWSRATALVVAPLALSMSLVVGTAACVIMAYKYAIVRAAYRDHATVVVEAGNAGLHMLPAAIVLFTFVLRWGERYRAHWQRVPFLHAATAVWSTSFLVSAAYFYWFSVDREYGSTNITEHDAQQYAVIAHLIVSGALLAFVSIVVVQKPHTS